jgi:hypothetical protein
VVVYLEVIMVFVVVDNFVVVVVVDVRSHDPEIDK